MLVGLREKGKENIVMKRLKYSETRKQNFTNFKSLPFPTSTEIYSEAATIIEVKSTIATKKIALILGSVLLVGVIATAGLIIGLSNLNRKDPATDPERKDTVDGQWSYWDKWSDCSTTCGSGTQFRERYCTSPYPQNGGEMCIGEKYETRICSAWNCPDCNRVCANNGTLSSTCDFCECPGTILYGLVTDDFNRPVDGAGVYLQSRPYAALARSNIWGKFFVSGICLIRETVLFQRNGFREESKDPSKLNASHWNVDMTLTKMVRPRFTKVPESKVRFVGQELTLCCEAKGNPMPTEYSWLKDGNTLGTTGSNGILKISIVSKSDSGSYSCRVETNAGVTVSSEAEVSIHDRDKTDSCEGKPDAKMETLAHECYFESAHSNLSQVDVGECKNKKCITDKLAPNGSCDEYWPSHRCLPKTKGLIEIKCKDGLVYHLNKVMACQCGPRLLTTTISGKVFGIKNGSQVPFVRGKVIINGGIVSYTSSLGYFSFVTTTEKPKLTIHFVDDTSGVLLDAVRVLQIVHGSRQIFDVIAQLKPTPVPFSSQIGFDLPLGSQLEDEEVASLSFPEDALMTKDGKPFNGSAKAFVNFIDPRRTEDIITMNGELLTNDPEGRSMPLETYGMFDISAQDSKGNQLLITKPIKTVMSADLFNISNDKDGNPDVSMWRLDAENGQWIEQSKFKYIESPGKGRKLLSQVIEGVFTADVEKLAFDVTKEFSSVRKYTKLVRSAAGNIDRRVTMYYTSHGREKKTSKDACLVRVHVYEDFTLANPGYGVSVTALTKTKDGKRFKGKDTRTVTKKDKGIVCIRIFCNSEVFILAEGSGKSLYALEKHQLPAFTKFQKIANGTQVKFISTEPFIGRTRDDKMYSPVYAYQKEKQCNDPEFSKTSFQFAALTKEPELHINTKNKFYDKTKSDQLWYVFKEEDPRRRACFLKLNVQSSFHGVRVHATSAPSSSQSFEDFYGLYITTPLWDESTDDRTNKGACIQFRCPGAVQEGSVLKRGIGTDVAVNLLANDGRIKCNVTKVQSDLKTTLSRRGFTFHAESNENYGPNYGVYIRNGKDDFVRNMCHSGTDRDISYTMKPNINFAVQMACVVL